MQSSPFEPLALYALNMSHSVMRAAFKWYWKVLILLSTSTTVLAAPDPSADSDPTLTIQNNSPSNYAELLATIIPRRNKGLKQRLRLACRYLPMPPALGWEPDPLDEETPPQSLVPGLLLSDIGSGATRRVDALWMHVLYNHTREAQMQGVTVIDLKEAHFSAQFGWGHRLILACILAQISVALYAIGKGQWRDGLLIFAGLILQVLEGAHWWTYPKFRSPRLVGSARFCALHMGSTTTHILVMSHNRDPDLPHHNLEDAAVPLPQMRRGRRKRIEQLLSNLLRVAWWSYRATCVLTATNGLLLPVVLSIGFATMEFLSTTFEALPSYRSKITLQTRSDLLDMLAAISQYTKLTSVGFTESILPDPSGNHTDYEWLKKVVEGGLAAGPHSRHPAANRILFSSLMRPTPRHGDV